MKKRFVRYLSLGITTVMLACGGGDGPAGPSDDDGNGGDGAPTRQILSNPSFGTDIQEIFNRRGCSASVCHGVGLSANLDLRTGAAFANLVNVVSFSDGAFRRVTPNDAQNSYLVMKLEDRQTVGARMPLNSTAVDVIDLTNIRNWIDTGAPNN
jgi:putative intracellular protease/amidase